MDKLIRSREHVPHVPPSKASRDGNGVICDFKIARPRIVAPARRSMVLMVVGVSITCVAVLDRFPSLRLMGFAFVGGCVFSLFGSIAIILLSSEEIPRSSLLSIGSSSSSRHYPTHTALLTPSTWALEAAALHNRQDYVPVPLARSSSTVNAAFNNLLAGITRDFVHSWYSGISKNPVFENEVDRAIRHALVNIRDLILKVDIAEAVTSRILPILTNHFHEFWLAERLVRGNELTNSVTESEELDLAIASRYRNGKVHEAVGLTFHDPLARQQTYLRKVVLAILPKLLPEHLLESRAVVIIIREIMTCTVLGSVVQILSDPDTWNQLIENYGLGMLQDRTTVRKLRAALDKHASPTVQSSTVTHFPRLRPHDSDRKFERFIRAIRQTSNLLEARRFRSEVASQLKRDSLKEGQDATYLRRLEISKRQLDQRIQVLASGEAPTSGQAQPSLPEVSSVAASNLETASLSELLRDAAALSYFMEHMDRRNRLSMVQFWLVVDGLRNPLEEDGPEDDNQEPLPSNLPSWTNSDRLDVAQIDQAYFSRPEIGVSPKIRAVVREFLKAGSKATPEQYYKARRAILRAQTTVLETMKANYFEDFQKSDLFFKCLASQEASTTIISPLTMPQGSAIPPQDPPLRVSSPKPAQVSRLANKPDAKAIPQKKTDLSPSMLGLSSSVNSEDTDDQLLLRRSLDNRSPPSLFDNHEAELEGMKRSEQSIGQASMTHRMPDKKVVQTMEQVLNNIMQDRIRPKTADDLRTDLFGDTNRSSSNSGLLGGMFEDDTSHKSPKEGSTLNQSKAKDATVRPSLASLGLVSAHSRIGVFVDDDLFGDEDIQPDEPKEDSASEGDIENEVVAAAPGDLGLAEAITALTADIDRLGAQEVVLDSLIKKAELTNNTAELRILRKSMTSLQRENRRKQLQRQQFVVQESDNSLFGKSAVKIKAIEVGRDREGKEFALYVIEVQRNAGEKMPAATWVVARRYSEFHELHQTLRSRYPSVRHLVFPRRRVMLKLQSDFLHKRSMALEQYLKSLLAMPDVCRSRDLRAFLSKTSITAEPVPGSSKDNVDGTNKKDLKQDIMARLADSVTEGVDDILGNIAALDQLSLASQNVIAAAINQQQQSINNPVDLGGSISNDAQEAAEAEAELDAFEKADSTATATTHITKSFIKPICDIFLEIFELNRGNNWLRGRAVAVVLQQLLGGTIEKKVRESVRQLSGEEAVVGYVSLINETLWPKEGRKVVSVRTKEQKEKTRTEAEIILAQLLPDLAGSVVGRLNAQMASRRLFATLNNERLKLITHHHTQDGSEFMGERLTVQYARGARRKDGSLPDRPPRTRRTVYRMTITGLPIETSWQDLKDFARGSGVDVVFSESPRDGNGRGHVEFETESDLKTAIDKLDNSEFKGQRVKCTADIQTQVPLAREPRFRSRSRSPIGVRRPYIPMDDYRRAPRYSPRRDERDDPYPQGIYSERSPRPREYYEDRRYRASPPRRAFYDYPPPRPSRYEEVYRREYALPHEHPYPTGRHYERIPPPPRDGAGYRDGYVNRYDDRPARW